MRVYLDNAATTPLAPEVLEAMIPVLREDFGNPSSSHAFGRETKALIETIDESSLDQALIDETAVRIARVRASSEGQEGIRSFLEKRKPNWVRENEH